MPWTKKADDLEGGLQDLGIMVSRSFSQDDVNDLVELKTWLRDNWKLGYYLGVYVGTSDYIDFLIPGAVSEGDVNEILSKRGMILEYIEKDKEKEFSNIDRAIKDLED